jgi:hypothetical protein
MGKLALSNEAIDMYFGSLLRNLDSDSKKRLIIKLTESLDAPSAEGSSLFDFMSRYGTWEDDRDTEVIINEIREARVGYVRHHDL